MIEIGSVKIKRLLYKLSGEALMGKKSYGYDESIINQICDDIVKVKSLGVEIAIVIGAGNIHRGKKT